MLFVLWFKFDPDRTNQVRELWKHFVYPEEVKVIGRYVLTGKGVESETLDTDTFDITEQMRSLY